MGGSNRYYAELTDREKIVHLDRLIQSQRNLDDQTFYRRFRMTPFSLLFAVVGVVMLYSLYVFLSTGAFQFRTDQLFTMLTLTVTTAVAVGLRQYAAFVHSFHSSSYEVLHDLERLKSKLEHQIESKEI